MVCLKLIKIKTKKQPTNKQARISNKRNLKISSRDRASKKIFNFDDSCHQKMFCFESLRYWMKKKPHNSERKKCPVGCPRKENYINIRGLENFILLAYISSNSGVAILSL